MRRLRCTRSVSKIICVGALIAYLSTYSSAVSGAKHLAIVGATLIDVRDFGLSTQDIVNAVVIVTNGRITAVGNQDDVKIPSDAEVLDATGLYIIPGLVDGYGALRTPGFAMAYTYEGVTTVFVQESPAGEDGEQRVLTSNVSPRILRGAMIGGYSADGRQSKEHPWTNHRLHDRRLTPQELTTRVDQISSDGFRGVLVGYDVWPDQFDVIEQEAHARGLVVLAELAFTSYPYAIRGGADALPHNDRYQTGIAFSQDQLAYSDDPVGLSGAPAYRDVCESDVNSGEVVAYGKQLAKSHTVLMPILSIEATADDVNVPNPWSLESAQFVRPEDLDDPVDPVTGERPYLKDRSEGKRRALKECAIHRQQLDRRFHELGAHFLAASGSPAYGIIPGSGLHEELKLLQQIGLTPREVLASATNNFSDIFGWHDLGLIEVGRRADMVILAADPRMDIRATDTIKIVIQEGHVIDRKRLIESAK
ncbi:MAG: amidohydrolase family protein [Bryobacteraceae bacterium]